MKYVHWMLMHRFYSKRMEENRPEAKENRA
jgi:hypothetical protein